MLSKSTEELDISNQQLRKEIEERLRAERELQHHTDNLETIIADRTWKLSLANQELSDTLKEMRVIQSLFGSRGKNGRPWHVSGWSCARN